MSEQDKPLKAVMKIHPFARTFDTLGGDELELLRDDIKANGIVVPILVNKKLDTIIDGRNRWQIATELGIQKDVPYDVFQGKDSEIEAEILRLNVFRRHLTEDQRIGYVSKVLGPKYEKAARERQLAAGKKSGSFKGNGEKGTSVAQLAAAGKTTTHKMGQAEKARKAGLIEDVIQKKMTLKQASKKAGVSKKKPRKTVRTFEDEVWMAWSRLLKHWPQTQHREVIKHVQTFINDRRPADAKTPSVEKAEAEKAEAAKAAKAAKKAPAKKKAAKAKK
jgi:ParB-like chromosome segregation protein Spo0J